MPSEDEVLAAFIQIKRACIETASLDDMKVREAAHAALEAAERVRAGEYPPRLQAEMTHTPSAAEIAKAALEPGDA